MKHIAQIINSQKTVFSRSDLQLLLEIPSVSGLSNFLMRSKKNTVLKPLQNGLRGLQHYNKYELACKIRRMSYVSLETILYEAGVIFQFSPYTISCISNDSRNYSIDGYTFQYHKIKNSILLNPLGITITATTMVATPERALCDLLYLNPNTVVENIDILNITKLQKIILIYPKTTHLALKKLIDGIGS